MNLQQYEADYTSKAMPFLEKHVLAFARTINFLARCTAPFWFLLTLACGRLKDASGENTIPTATRTSLVAKHASYLEWSKTHRDNHGFIMSDTCDSLLFSALYAAGGGSVDILAARTDVGAWLRRPTDEPACYPTNSSSSISQDMLEGLMIYIYRLSKTDAPAASDMVNQLYDYGVAHSWNMGDGDPARTYLRPALQGTLAELRYRLTGKDDKLARNLPQVWVTSLTDYEEHLQAMHIYLRGSLLGGMDVFQLRAIQHAVTDSPDNAFYQYVLHAFTDKDQSAAANILLDIHYFPADRLPNTMDYATDYLWQRDEHSANWLPDPSVTPVKEHTGADFLFVSNLILVE